jgi:RHS repeat-associated protein
MRSDRRRVDHRRHLISLCCAAILAVQAVVACTPQDEPDPDHPSPPSTDAIGGLPPGERPTSSGDYQKSVALQLPPYYGITPSLQLRYDSRVGDGWLGVGWRMDGISAIRRLGPGKGVPTYSAADSFFLDGAELVRCAAGTQGPSCANQVGAPFVGYAARSDDYRRYAFDPRPPGGSWQVWRKDGAKYTYEARAGQPSATSAWDLRQVEDTSGHTVRYDYVTEQPAAAVGESYPSRVTFGGMAVDFHYKDRTDPVTYGNGRVLITSNRLLNTLVIRVGADLVRVYRFSYRTHPHTGRSALAEVRQFGNDVQLDKDGNVLDAANASSLPPVRFEQQQTSSDLWGIAEASSDDWGVPLEGGRPLTVMNGLAFVVTEPFFRLQPSNLGDIDGNGRTDWVQATPDAVFDPTARHTKVLITAAVAGRGAPIHTQEELAWPYGKALFKTTLMGDVDADGRSDLVFVVGREKIPGANPNHSPFYLGIGVARSTGDGHFTWLTSTVTETSWETRESTGNRVTHCLLGDVNGDARQDVLCSFTKGDGNHYLGTATSAGDGSFAVREEPAPFATQGETRLLAVGDTNGDGLSDPMFLDFPHCPDNSPGCTVQYELVTALSAGDHYATFEREKTTWDRGQPTFFAADINGDDKDDYVLFKSIANPGEAGEIQTAYRGFEGAWVLSQTAVPPALNQIPNSVSVGDADGDRRADLLVISRQENGRPGCGTGFSGAHVNLHRVLSRGNGTFALPSSWEDCSRSREVDIAWADVGYTPVEPQAADLDGDRTADFLIATSREGEDFTTLREDLSGPSTVDLPNWRSAELNADGRGDWVFVRNTPTGPLISSMLATSSGYTQRAQSPVPGTSHFTVQDGWRVGDINADGSDDLVYLDYTTPEKGISVGSWLAQPNGAWSQRTVNVLAGLAERHRNTASWQLIEIDGDGKLDLLYVDQSDTGAGLATWSLLAKGDGTWTEVPDKPLPQWGGEASNRRVTDVNGDGRTDLQYITATATEISVHTAIGAGDGTWTASPTNPATWTRKAGDGIVTTDRRAWWVADVNGDGLSDVFTVSPTSRDPKQPFEVRVLTLLGHGDGGYSGRDNPQPAGNVTGDMVQWRMANVSNDHRADLVHVRVAPPGIVVTTLTFSHNGTWHLMSPDINVSTTSRTTVGNRFVLADTDGNGQDDLTRFDRLPQGMRLLTLRSSFNRDVMTRLTSPEGAVTNIDYVTRADLALGPASTSCHLPVKVQPLMVRKISVSAGSGSAGGTATYDYDCPVWSNAHRTFLGWRDVFAQRPATVAQAANTVHHRFQLSDACFTQATYIETYDAQGKVLAKKITAPISAGNTAPFTCGLVNYVDDITINAAGQAMNVYTYYTHDAFGNVTGVSEYGADLEKNGDERTTTIVYRPATGPYIVGLPHQQVLSEGTQPAGAGLRYTYFCYDGDNGTAQTSCAGTITKGLVTAKKVVNPNGWYDTTFYHYDQFGNVDHITDADGRETAVTYDPTYHRFPEQVCDPTARCTTMGWDPGLARATSVTDSENVRTELRYDAFGRPWQVLPSGRAKTEYSYPDFGDPVKQRIRTVIDDDTDDGLWSESYLDGLGRPYRDIREGGAAGSRVVRDTVYVDAGSGVAQQSFWHADDTAAVLESYTYDALSKPTSHRHADGAEERWSYDNDTIRTAVQHQDELGHTTTIYRDAYGRTVGAQQPTTKSTMETSYSHDAADQLKTITEKPPSGAATTINRDLRGDLRGITNLDGGAVSLDEYDRTGRVRRIIDPNDGWTRLTYDKAGRIESKTAPSYREMKVYYGESGHGKAAGQVTSVTDTLEFGCTLKSGFGGYVTKELFYDPYGRIERTKQCIDGKTVTFTFGYDKLDRVRTMTYPDMETVTYDYDSSGRVRSVSGYADDIRYDAAGRVTTLKLTNGTTQTYHYDPTRSWLDKIEATGGNGTVFDLAYSHYLDGSVRGTTSSTNMANLGYSYDAAGQLTDVTGDVPQQFQYDATGNMVVNSELGTYTYDMPSGGGAGCGSSAKSIACPHAVKHVGAAELVYDNLGNLTSVINGSSAFAHLKSIQWNKDMQPVTFTDENGVQTKLRYDENGQRVYRNRAGQVSLYFDPFVDMDYTVGQPELRTTQFYFAGNLLLAKKDASGKTWYHSDEIGSVRATTGTAGALAARFDYTPFGRVLGSTNAASARDRRYAGHRIDPDNDLIYMGARYYAPSIGKFISPDPVIPTTFMPMAMNRYAYAYNNPLSYVDPLGLGPYDLGIEGQLTSPRNAAPDLFSVHGLLGQAQPATVPDVAAITALSAGSYQSASPVGGTITAATAATSPLLPNGLFEITPLPPKTTDPATSARRLVDLLKKALAPLRVTGMAIGGMVDVNANGCGIFCFLVGDLSVGYLMTPAGANDWFFGDVHLFGSVGGAVLGVTPGPAEPIDFLALDRPSGWQYSLGLSAGVGISAMGFVTEASTPEAFSEFARTAGVSVGPVTGFRSENTAGQATYGIGLGFSRSWFVGGNVFNTYTIVSPGIWPSWLPAIPYR